jgi:lipoyl-dependent peroxiredoxin
MAIFSRHAELEWNGGVTDGEGRIRAGAASFDVGATFPSVGGESPGKTTPEEMLAASHAICYGVGLRSLIGRRGGRARRVTVTATITAEKGPSGIRIQSSHLSGVVAGLEGIDEAQLAAIARETEEGCTISIALRGNVTITSETHVVV